MSGEDKALDETIGRITKSMESLINDTSVPKNVRSAISEAKQKLNASGEYTIRIASAIYNVDYVSSDINLPPQARTVIWNILSMLEAAKEAEG